MVVVKPPVSISQGEGYSEVKDFAEASRGDQVMAGPGGQARIVYPDGCAVPVGPGGVASVGECKQPMTAGLEPIDEKAMVPPPAAFPWVPVVLGALIVGGGICAVACEDDDNGGGSKPPILLKAPDHSALFGTLLSSISWPFISALTS